MSSRAGHAFEPGSKLFFAVMVLFVVASFFFSYILAVCEAAAVILVYLIYRRMALRRRRELLRYIESVSISAKSDAKGSVLDFPLPIVILQPENGRVVWTNEQFGHITGRPAGQINSRIDEYVKDFSLKWLMEGKAECPTHVRIRDRSYQVFGSLVRKEREVSYTATLFWVDVTDFIGLKGEYLHSRPVVSLILVDNYEEIMKNTTDANKSAILAAVDEKITKWAEGSECLMRKYDRDKYVLVFEERQIGRASCRERV